MIPRTSAALAILLLTGSGRAHAQAQTDSPASPYRAVLRGGVAHASPDPDTLSLFAQLDVEAVHAPIGAGWDAAMGFQFGRQPLLVMIRTPGATATASHTGGYVMSESMRFARASGFAETAVVGRLGATRADAGEPIARNDISDWAFVADVRADLRVFDPGARRTHGTEQSLDPIVDAWLGVRHDQRFHRAGDLSGFDDPPGRIVGGVTVNAIRMPARGVTVGGEFEFERALRGAVPLPSGARVTLAASLELRRQRP